MSPADSITVALDRPRALRWTHRAQFIVGSMERPPTYADLGHKNSHRAFHALCVFVWASIADRDHPFTAPIDVASHLEKPEEQVAALTAVVAALRHAGVIAQKKTNESGSDSKTGPLPSSSSAPAAQTSTTALPPSG